MVSPERRPADQAEDDDGMSLSSILESFNGPLNEEQAWALCYQVVKHVISRQSEVRFVAVERPDDVYVKKDGSVYISSSESCPELSPCKNHRYPDDVHPKTSSAAEKKFIASLGVLLYKALDYGYDENEERSLDASLEVLIERLSSADSKPDLPAEESDDEGDDGHRDSCDEGIEGDDDGDDDHSSHGGEGLTLEAVIEMCVGHLKLPDQADSHYRAVCRALQSEAKDLSMFLSQITKGTKELRELSGQQDPESPLDELRVADWARLWIQLVHELRQGVKLKKVAFDENHRNTEYELTPYEMLLDDIRSQRYKLKHVSADEDIPQRVKKDAHALILEFIRSRPPLVPASRRKLAPTPPKNQSMYDKLMDSIRQQHKLKPTPPPSVKTSPLHLGRVRDSTSTVETSRTKLVEEQRTPAPRRRLIKADLRLSNNFDEDDEIVVGKSLEDLSLHDDSDEDRAQDAGTKSSSRNVIPRVPSSLSLDHPTSSHDSSRRKFSLKSFSRFLSLDRSDSRRHSITVCESPAPARSTGSLQSAGVSETKREDNNNHHDDEVEEELVVDPNEDTRDRVASIWAATDWGKTYDCLSLTLEEIQHIRSVLTKAELESLSVTRAIKEDLENSRICFTCLKTRFSFFGPWKVDCKLCDRSICEKCVTKMHITTDRFDKVPIYMLSPTPTPSPEDDDPRFLPSFALNIINDHFDERKGPEATTSKKEASKRSKLFKSLTLKNETGGHKSQPETETSEESDAEVDIKSLRKSGPVLKLCRDCKLLVRHIIDVGYTNYDSEQQKRTPNRRFTSPRFVN